VSGAAPKPGIPDFELVRVVGRGSYGDVWLARSVTGAWRAIKVVWRERFTNAEPFEREFRGLKEFADISLGESSQMTLLHVGRNDAAGFFYYVMELADDAERGRHIDPENYVPFTLAEMRMRRGRIPADECARFGAEVARVLASLHRRGLVHRDVKPSNVILVSGVPKLADVGLVAPTASARTFVGTEGYVPPEGPGVPSADVFALGKVLYELSTGHDRQEFPKLPAGLARLPDRAALLELNEILRRACGPAAERYRDGAAILADLTALNAGVSLRTRRFSGFLLRAAGAVSVVAALGLGGWYWKTRPSPPPPPVAAGVSSHSVAVLSLTNATGDPRQDYLSDGISDEILHALARERELDVTGNRSSFWFKDNPAPIAEIAQRLRVAQLVEGSLQRVGTRYRLQVRLTRGLDGMSEDVGTFEREPREVFLLADDVARAVAQKILGRVTMPPLVPPTRNLAAYGAFLRGRALQSRGVVNSAAEVEKNLKLAVDLDPDFAVAWARLAEVRHRIAGIWTPEGSEENSPLPTVERALALQPELPLALTVRAFMVGVGMGKTADAQRDLVRAEELGGRNAETLMTRFLVSWFAGEPRGLLQLARDAISRNPENIERITIVPAAMEHLGDYIEADRLLQQAKNFIGRINLRRKWRGAEAALRLVERSPSHPDAFVMRVRMLAALGRREVAAKCLEEWLGANEPKPAMWSTFADAGLIDRARELAAAAFPAARTRLEEVERDYIPRTEIDRNRRDGARSSLIGIEIFLGNHDSALALLDRWRKDAEQLPLNRRYGGITSRIPIYYAQLGKHDVAIELLRQSMDTGIMLGYDLRDTPDYAALKSDLRFLELCRRAEAWAASRPNPPDDPAATPGP
jgi:serine/threonine protein kinase